MLIPVQVELVDATADGTTSLNAIVCQPLPPFSANLGDIDFDGNDDYDTNMPDGQYTVGLFANLKNTQGVGLRDGPVFHTFTVGATDTIPRASSRPTRSTASRTSAPASRRPRRPPVCRKTTSPA